MVGSTEKVRLLPAAVRCQNSGGWFGVEGVPRAKLIQLFMYTQSGHLAQVRSQGP